ncbi:MAG: glycosyltransferase family 39 protein [Nitrospirota bacterium]
MKEAKRADLLLIVSLLAALTFPVLYILRFADNNTLTSWRWVFSNSNFITVNILIISGIVVSYIASHYFFHERYSLLLLSLLPFAITIPLWQEPEIIIDASRYFLQAKHLEVYGAGSYLNEWGKEISAWTDLPLVPFIYGLIFRYCGESRLYIQLFNSLLFTSAVLLTYQTGKLFFNRETGVFGGLLLLGIPYLHTQVPLMLVDLPVMFFFTLATYLFLKATSQGGLSAILFSSLSLFLAIFSKYSAWLMLMTLPLTAIITSRQGSKRTIYRSGMIFGIAVALTAVLVALRYDVFYEQIRLLASYQWPGLKKWEEGFASTFLFQSHPFIIILAVIATIVAIKRKDKQFLIMGWAALFIIVLQIKRIRYIIPLFPFIALMASYGLCSIKEKNIKRFIVFCIITYSFVISSFGYLPFLNKTSAVNLKDAGVYLDSLKGDYVEVYALPQSSSSGNTASSVPILDLFTNKKIIFKHGGRPEEAGELWMKSPLRFTWEMKMPGYYSYHSTEPPITAIISGSEKPLRELHPFVPPHTGLMEFRTDNKAYRYKTFVTVFAKEGMSGKEQ